METAEYTKHLELALIDVAGNLPWYDIQYATGLSEKRCKEIEDIIQSEVYPRYKNKHSI